MNISKGLAVSLLILLGLAGCSGTATTNSITTIAHNADSTSALKDKYRLSTLVNSPKVVIAKSKEQNNQDGGSLMLQGEGKTRIFGGTERKSEDGYERDTQTLSGGEDGLSNGFLGSLNDMFGNNKNSGRLANRELVDDTLPVVSTVYGGPVTVIKAINGGFGILLMKQGVPQNKLACTALFKTLPSMEISDITQFAVEYEAYFRPTYWLDSRPKKQQNEDKKSVQLASATNEPNFNSYLVYASTNSQQPKSKKKQSSNLLVSCLHKLKHYNYAVSHALLKRLNLQNKRGPFLVAWREDGSKAMVLNMSKFNDRLDFEESLETWMKKIVRHPKVWESGIVENTSIKRKLRRILNKGGKSILSLLSPSKAQAYSAQ